MGLGHVLTFAKSGDLELLFLSLDLWLLFRVLILVHRHANTLFPFAPLVGLQMSLKVPTF